MTFTSWTDARMVVVRSARRDSSIAGGIDGLELRQQAVTRSTVSMMLAPGWRKMINRTAGFPLARPAARISSTESVTVATSRKAQRAAVAYE